MCPLVGSADPLAATEGGMVDMNYDDMPAGPEMDGLVATKVMEWEQVDSFAWCDSDGTVRTWDVRDGNPIRHWHPSTDIACAWEVLEKLRRHIFQLSDDEGWCCTFSMRFNAKADTAPLAICRAALKAVE